MGRHGRKMTSGQPGIPSRKTIEKVMHSVVQIVALRRGSLGNYSTAWTGSGTIVDPSGFVLTNCHVGNPRAMGMPSPEADKWWSLAATATWPLRAPYASAPRLPRGPR